MVCSKNRIELSINYAITSGVSLPTISSYTGGIVSPIHLISGIEDRETSSKFEHPLHASYRDSGTPSRAYGVIPTNGG